MSDGNPSEQAKQQPEQKPTEQHHPDTVKLSELPASLQGLKSGTTPEEAQATAQRLEKGLQKFYATTDVESHADLKHKFWGTQPVPSTPKEMPHSFDKTSEIEDSQAKKAILRHTPLDLPPDLEWFDVDLSDDKMMKEVHDLLANHYVEDSDAWFRFDYSTESIRWACSVPGTYPEWIFGIRTRENHVMVGFITAVPQIVNVQGKEVHCVVVDFLCVHKQLRAKRLAPLLIAEITRRCNVRGIFQAVYTGVLSPPLLLFILSFLLFFSYYLLHSQLVPSSQLHSPPLPITTAPSIQKSCSMSNSLTFHLVSTSSN